MSEIYFPTTGDRILDSLLAFGIMDISLMVDTSVRFELTLGQDIFLKVKTKETKEKFVRKIISQLDENSKNFILARRLNFIINVGNIAWSTDYISCIYCTGARRCDAKGNCGRTNIPAYAIFRTNIKKALSSFRVLVGNTQFR